MEKTTKTAKTTKTSKKRRVLKKNNNNYLSLFNSSKMRFVLVAVMFIFLATFAFLNRRFFIVATVDGKPITRLTLVRELEKRAGSQVLEELILKKAIELESQKKGLTVSQQEVDAEVKKMEDEIKSQGGDLDQVLSFQGLDRTSLRESLRVRKLLEKLMSDKLKVSDEEVSKYIEENKETLPKDKSEEDTKSYVKDILKQQKYSQEIGAFLEELKSKINIVNFYKK